MKKKVFWKDIRKSFSSSKGRFLSIMLLMMLGAFALTGLKVTTPDMEKTASQYLKKSNTMDISVISEYGFSVNDRKEIDSIKDVEAEYGYMSDVTIEGTNDAVRIFSNSKGISIYHLVSGNLPSQSNEIAISSTLENRYGIGDTIQFTQNDNGVLKNSRYKIVGFVESSEIWSSTDMGSSTAGDGTLSAYAVVTEAAFDSDFYTIARLKYDNLNNLNPYSEDYAERLSKNQEKIDKILSDNGDKRLEELRSELKKDLEFGQSQLDAVKNQFEQKSVTLSLLEGEQLVQAKIEAKNVQKKINEGEKELADLQNKIDSLNTPTYNTYTRSTFPGGEGYYTYDSIRGNISKIGNLFPIVLYLVAALVTFTTMTRFVNEERNNSGILKALGYSNTDVVKKFVIYGLISSLIGTVIGIFAGHYLLPRVVTRLVATTMTVGAPKLYFYWFYTMLSVLLAIISAVLPALWIARRELSEKAAQLLLPKPPVKGDKILLERFRFIWTKMSFTQKVTARNIFRYKLRMLMTIFGVTGSVTLLFAGLGIQSSLSRVVDRQFHQIAAYDMMVLKNNSATSKELSEVTDFLDTNSKYQSVYYKTVNEKITGQTEKKPISILSSDKNDFKTFINLISTESDKEVLLSDQGAVISEKLAEYYNVKVGDSFTFKDTDNLNHIIKVNDIVEMKVGHYIFMNDVYYKKNFGNEETNNAYLVNLKNNTNGNISEQASKLLSMDGVSTVSQNLSAIKTLNTAVEALNASMTILVVVSILLGVVILYNLTNINVAERIRELSTIKVLGFHNREVTLYIYRETIILSLLGIVLGLIGGHYLHNIIIDMMSKDEMYPKDVNWLVYVIPVITIIVVLTLLGLLVNHRLKIVDMLEALKSVD
ncbi:FtsX-like permease family protein [Streptococcus sp. H49]|uniref:FtsX-like permease family protein n=1 Tax=Streptococcus huangxiaojuni TaxID=3237239 RepID=UPI0034A4A91E